MDARLSVMECGAILCDELLGNGVPTNWICVWSCDVVCRLYKPCVDAPGALTRHAWPVPFSTDDRELANIM